jgi:aspartyl-tRNA(Asn)/glutamyl-tRNA(Gln) amidotransferase subunit C
MNITAEEIKKLAHLARLQFNEKEVVDMQADMQKILAFVEKIKELDLDGLEPLEFLNPSGNVLRADEALQEISHEEALSNAPLRDTDYFKVPKVIGAQAE